MKGKTEIIKTVKGSFKHVIKLFCYSLYLIALFLDSKHTYMHTHIYTYIDTYIHIYIYIYTDVLVVVFIHQVMSDSLQLHGLQHTRLPYPSPSPSVCSNSCPLSWWCHPTISSSVAPFSCYPQSFPASGSFLMSRLFTSGGQYVGASASVLPMNIQHWFYLG